MNNNDDETITARIKELKKLFQEKDTNLAKMVEDKQNMENEIKQLEAKYTLMHSAEFIEIEQESKILNERMTTLEEEMKKCKEQIRFNNEKRCNVEGHQWMECNSFTRSDYMECLKCKKKVIYNEKAMRTGKNPEKPQMLPLPSYNFEKPQMLPLPSYNFEILDVNKK